MSHGTAFTPGNLAGVAYLKPASAAGKPGNRDFFALHSRPIMGDACQPCTTRWAMSQRGRFCRNSQTSQLLQKSLLDGRLRMKLRVPIATWKWPAIGVLATLVGATTFNLWWPTTQSLVNSTVAFFRSATGAEPLAHQGVNAGAIDAGVHQHARTSTATRSIRMRLHWSSPSKRYETWGSRPTTSDRSDWRHFENRSQYPLLSWSSQGGRVFKSQLR